MSFRLTEAAAREILAAAGRSGADGLAFRVAARPTREGLAYAMGFDEPSPDDEVAVVAGLSVLVAPSSRELLGGTVLDYVQLDTGQRDFVFVAPQAGGACATTTGSGGCGSGRCAGCS